jgi:hypothetical protein
VCIGSRSSDLCYDVSVGSYFVEIMPGSNILTTWNISGYLTSAGDSHGMHAARSVKIVYYIFLKVARFIVEAADIWVVLAVRRLRLKGDLLPSKN